LIDSQFAKMDAKVGFELYMVKPVRLDDLRHLLARPDLASLRAGGEDLGPATGPS
jgi:hypothetical protein